MNENTVIGFTSPTTPPSTELDTLKALVLRNVDRLEYVIDQIAGTYGLPEEFIEYVDSLRLMQLHALAEHVPVANDEQLNELRYVHPDGLKYADGSLIVEHWHEQYGVTDFYPRYDGDRAKRRQEFEEWVACNKAQADTETKFLRIVDGIEDE